MADKEYYTEMAIYYDSSLCSGCKACQVACKSWNCLPSPTGYNEDLPSFTGTYQNPPDLNNMTRLIMTFNEHVGGPKGIQWAFGRRSCQHCHNAPCAQICPSGAIYIDEETKLVPTNPELCIGCQYCSIACPFGVPRYYNAGPGAAFTKTTINKCTGCIDRVRHGLKPACVNTCQPGALQFGEWQEMVDLGHARVAELKERGFEDAVLYGEEQMGGLHVIHVLKYGIAAHDQNPNPERRPLVDAIEIMKPVTGLASGSVVVGLGVMAGLAAGYKRDKMTYNPATTDTISVDTGDVLKRGDGQDTESVRDHIFENLPFGKKRKAAWDAEDALKAEGRAMKADAKAERREEREERHEEREERRAERKDEDGKGGSDE